ncbi:CNT_collapsed_G0015460.mRNA.1.CDS.1 [Saccharomyces cerevisiae]|nr:CNT_collapsed_G0015460.mRNA.1.CDS.1 [Saccharomyces cerevisiae]
MVEEAVEEGRDMQDLPENDVNNNENENPDEHEGVARQKRRDAALVDHGALMHELQLIKQAMHEDEIKNKACLPGEDKEVESSNDFLGESHYKPPSTPKINPPQSPNNFQLLSAGRTILPEDDDFDPRGKRKWNSLSQMISRWLLFY